MIQTRVTGSWPRPGTLRPFCPACSAVGLESWRAKGVPRGQAGHEDAPLASAALLCRGRPSPRGRPCCAISRGPAALGPSQRALSARGMTVASRRVRGTGFQRAGSHLQISGADDRGPELWAACSRAAGPCGGSWNHSSAPGAPAARRPSRCAVPMR